ncbi:hypothetical protein [Roseobacter sp. HKCCA0434]|uniref:hypothetical protein n=1 Tax=Roseobacter sp. HKCCA0434 TaxID=3079297 RepID=UPI002905CF29|nr:hypothetical protein [Roseobacter sp. HKCCA0434]
MQESIVLGTLVLSGIAVYLKGNFIGRLTGIAFGTLAMWILLQFSHFLLVPEFPLRKTGLIWLSFVAAGGYVVGAIRRPSRLDLVPVALAIVAVAALWALA